MADKSVENMAVKVNVDASDAIKTLKALQRSAKETARSLRAIGLAMAVPLIKIELDDLNGVPKVFYKGVEITHQKRIRFDWLTDDYNRQPTHLKIEHFDEFGRLKVIEHNPEAMNRTTETE